MMQPFSKKTLALLLFLPLFTKAQRTLEPYIGYGMDVNNKPVFSQVSIGLQYPLINKPVFQMLIGVTGALPLNKQGGTDIAYAADPSLALDEPVAYKTKLYAAMLYITNRVKLVSWGKNSFSPFLSAGLGRQSISVRHRAYNAEKYTVLNPHRSFDGGVVFMGGGLQYKYQLSTGYLFLQPEISSALFAEKENNYHYKQPVLLALNLGYGIGFKKRNK